MLPKNIRAETTAAEILIHIEGEIGGWTWEEGAINDAPWLRKLLADAGAPTVRVRINSPGGGVFAGVSIFNVLRTSGKRVITECVGLAASSASVVFMAGDERHMLPGTMVMIHNALAFADGNAAALRKMAETLDAVSAEMADLYAKATGHSVDTIRAWMDAETWFGPALAAQHAFATHLADAGRTPAARIAASALGRFRNLPAELKAQASSPLMLTTETLALIGLTPEADAASVNATIAKLHADHAALRAAADTAEAKAKADAEAALRARAESAVGEAVDCGALAEAERAQAVADFLAAPEANARLLAKLTASAKSVAKPDGLEKPLVLTGGVSAVSVDAVRAQIAEAEPGEARAAIYRAHAALMPVGTGAKAKFAKADPVTAKALGIIG